MPLLTSHVVLSIAVDEKESKKNTSSSKSHARTQLFLFLVGPSGTQSNYVKLLVITNSLLVITEGY